jgi:HNH endonuclease/AP2 domain
LDQNGYVVRTRHAAGRAKKFRLHRVVLELKPGDPEVDHINGNRLDNRRSNLRVASHSENEQNRHGLSANNTSGYRGVTWNKRARKWSARAKLNGHSHFLGYFDTPEEANDAVTVWRAEHMPFSADARIPTTTKGRKMK